MMVGMWSKENTLPLMAGAQTSTTILEIMWCFLRKLRINIPLDLDTTLGHILKGDSILPQHLLNYGHCCFIHNGQKLQTTLMFLNKRLNKENVAHLCNRVKYWDVFPFILTFYFYMILKLCLIVLCVDFSLNLFFLF